VVFVKNILVLRSEFLYKQGPFVRGRMLAEVNTLMGIVSKQLEVKEKFQSLNETVERTHRLSLAIVVHANFINEMLIQLTQSVSIPCD